MRSVVNSALPLSLSLSLALSRSLSLSPLSPGADFRDILLVSRNFGRDFLILAGLYEVFLLTSWKLSNKSWWCWPFPEQQPLDEASAGEVCPLVPVQSLASFVVRVLFLGSCLFLCYVVLFACSTKQV